MCIHACSKVLPLPPQLRCTERHITGTGLNESACAIRLLSEVHIRASTRSCWLGVPAFRCVFAADRTICVYFAHLCVYFAHSVHVQGGSTYYAWIVESARRLQQWRENQGALMGIFVCVCVRIYSFHALFLSSKALEKNRFVSYNSALEPMTSCYTVSWQKIYTVHQVLVFYYINQI